MKILKRILMTGALVGLASAAAFAQKNDEPKKPKPKDNPPEIVVPKDGKKPPKETDRPRDGRKKPQGDFAGEFRPVEMLD